MSACSEMSAATPTSTRRAHVIGACRLQRRAREALSVGCCWGLGPSSGGAECGRGPVRGRTGADGEGGTPLILEDVQTDGARFAADVWVPDLGLVFHLRPRVEEARMWEPPGHARSSELPPVLAPRVHHTPPGSAAQRTRTLRHLL